MAQSPVKTLSSSIRGDGSRMGTGAPVTARERAAQIKNPIEAAKEAFKKAREQEEAKRRQQAPPPQQPTQAPVSPSAPGAATAECCSPEALGKLAASVGFVDVVGVKLGMTLEQAVAAIKVANPKLMIDIHDGEIEAGGKQSRRPRGMILAHLPAGQQEPAGLGQSGWQSRSHRGPADVTAWSTACGRWYPGYAKLLRALRRSQRRADRRGPGRGTAKNCTTTAQPPSVGSTT